MTPGQTLRLGTRRSALAQTQSRHVAAALEAAHPGLSVRLVPVVTEGDRKPGDLTPVGGKGLFTRELEEGLEAGDLDLAVHSLKDLPARFSDALVLAAYPERVDPRDVLVSESSSSLDDLAEGAVLLTGSQRRKAQILARRPDLRVEPIRGNVETRIRKWRRSRAEGLILAAAGLSRLGLEGVPIHPVDPDRMIPAPGQGVLAVQVLRNSPAEELCRALDHPPTARAARAERALVTAFGGDCTLPFGAWAREAREQELRLIAVLATPDGELVARGEARGDDPEAVATECLENMRRDGVEEVLDRLGHRIP
ncbi:MAG: hydroxymethylbilane synthase [Thermoanaerobaculia bacterium]|nr:hydroxymethylbilane synthase [Thermoanaerobaculia bacterium]